MSDEKQAQQHSVKAGRIRLAKRLGDQYGGDRQIYDVAGYVAEDNLEFGHYWGYYQRDGIAGRIIDMPPQTTWRNPPEITGPDGETDGELVAAFEDMRDRLRLWHRFERADRLARIGQYGALLIGVRGDDAELREEMPTLMGPEDVIYLSAFHEDHLDIETWIDDPGNPMFGQPETYRVDLSADVAGFEASTTIVHHSRIIHIAEDLLADEVFGRPALKRVMNDLFDMEKVKAATAEAFWQLADKILALSLDPDTHLSPDDEKKLGEAMEEIAHDLRRQMILQGGELGWIGGDTPDPTGPANMLMIRLAAGAGIPKRVLFGTETGERASQQDERQWLGSIAERQEQFAEPTILRAFIDRLQKYGALPAGEYEVQWPNLHEPTAEEEAERNKSTADTAKALTPVGGDPYELVEVDSEGAVHLRPSEEVNEEREQMEEEGPLPMDPGPPEAQEPPGESGSEEVADNLWQKVKRIMLTDIGKAA